jgi:hypothetical protein
VGCESSKIGSLSSTSSQHLANMAKPSKSGNSAVGKAPRSPSTQKIVKKSDDYTSDGVKDHDIFLLPGSDYQVMLAVTVLATVVRLFRIYQPSSVVFDEVQYAPPNPKVCEQLLTGASTASEDSRRNTSRADSSWMSTPRSLNYSSHWPVG